MATDMKFKISEGGALNDPTHRACRSAVAYKLGARGALHTVNRETLQPVYDNVVKKWRFRLIKLRDAGWNYLNNVSEPEKQFVFTRNCPPHGALFDQEKRLYRCRRSKVCPHCYSRDIVMKACLAFEVGQHALRYFNNPQLVGFQRLMKLEVSKWPVADLIDGLHMTGAHTIELQPLRNQVDGSAIFVNVSLDNAGTHWLVRRSGVFITEKADLKVEFKGVDAGHSVRKLDGCSMKNACRMLAWAGRYPTTMMTAPQDQVAELLNHIEKSQFKQLRFGGLLRNGDLRKRRMKQIADSQKAEKV